MVSEIISGLLKKFLPTHQERLSPPTGHTQAASPSGKNPPLKAIKGPKRTGLASRQVRLRSPAPEGKNISHPPTGNLQPLSWRTPLLPTSRFYRLVDRQQDREKDNRPKTGSSVDNRTISLVLHLPTSNLGTIMVYMEAIIANNPIGKTGEESRQGLSSPYLLKIVFFPVNPTAVQALKVTPELQQLTNIFTRTGWEVEITVRSLSVAGEKDRELNVTL